MWPYLEDDFMEMGDTGLVPIGEGWYLNKANNHRIDPNGNEFDEDGNLIKEAM